MMFGITLFIAILAELVLSDFRGLSVLDDMRFLYWFTNLDVLSRAVVLFPCVAVCWGFVLCMDRKIRFGVHHG